ncbi:MAG: hypothetical protein HRT44_04195 [Bdellovibrionales bacterium]|nr:hypothetical protein [Bdellovibrionales bacterium]
MIRYTPILGNTPLIQAQVFNHHNNSELVITDSFIEFGTRVTGPLIHRARIRPTYNIVNEVRHLMQDRYLDNGNKLPDEPGHVFCNRGAYKGSEFKACDQRLVFASSEEKANGMDDSGKLAAGSGYSFEFAFLLLVRSHPITDSKIREEAQYRLRELATHHFNELQPGALEHYGITLIPQSEW